MKALGKGSVAAWAKLGFDIVRWLLWTAALIVAALALGYIGLLAATSAGKVSPTVLVGLESHMHLSSDVEFTGAGPRWPVFLWVFTVVGVSLAGALIIVDRLRKLFAGFSSGEPFRKEYADHLRTIWITMVVVELAKYLLAAVFGALLAVLHEGHGSLTINLNIDLSAWMAILVLIVLAEVFREGARMREEQELTI